MDIEEETIYQLLLAGGAVAAFVGAAVVVSTLYGTNGNLTRGGGTALIVTIALFILAMLAAGLWLERQEF